MRNVRDVARVDYFKDQDLPASIQHHTTIVTASVPITQVDLGRSHRDFILTTIRISSPCVWVILAESFS